MSTAIESFADHPCRRGTVKLARDDDQPLPEVLALRFLPLPYSVARRAVRAAIRLRPVLSAEGQTVISQSWPAAKGLIQIAQQLSGAASAARCFGIAFEHVDDGRCRATSRLLNVLGTHVPIVSSDKLGRSRRVCRCPENVLHLVGVGQWMQVRGGCRTHRCPRCMARGLRVCATSGLERRPCGVAQ